MAHVEVSKLGENEKAQLACTYAALLLADSGLDMSADKIKAVLKSTKNEVAAFWPAVFANSMAKHNVDDLIASAGCAAGPAAAAPAGGAAAAPAKEAEKEVEEEEVDMDMGGLFGDDY